MRPWSLFTLLVALITPLQVEAVVQCPLGLMQILFPEHQEHEKELERLASLTDQDRYVPILPTKPIKSEDLLAEERKILRILREQGMELRRSQVPTKLKLSVENSVDPDVIPAVDGTKFYGTVYEVLRLPKPAESLSAAQPAFFHPEMQKRLKELQAGHYKLCIDTSLILSNTEAYLNGYSRIISLSPDSKWSMFRHEFQHFEFRRTGAKAHFDYLFRERLIHRRDISKGRLGLVRKKIGIKSLTEIQGLFDQGITPVRAVDEALAVKVEIMSYGEARFRPEHFLFNRGYELKHRITELLKLGSRLTTQQDRLILESKKELLVLRRVAEKIRTSEMSFEEGEKWLSAMYGTEFK